MLTDLRLGKHLNDIVGANFTLITEALKSCMFQTNMPTEDSKYSYKSIVMKVLIKNQRGEDLPKMVNKWAMGMCPETKSGEYRVHGIELQNRCHT